MSPQFTHVVSPELLAVVAIVGSLFALVVMISFVKRIGWLGGESKKAQALEGVREFRERIVILEKKRDILQEFASEYYNTLSEAGWDEFISLVLRLRDFENALQEAVHERSYSQVVEISEYLLGRSSPDHTRVLLGRYPELGLVANWQERSRKLLLELVEATTEAAEQVREVGIKRRRIRKATLVSLEGLREYLRDGDS